MGLPEKVYTERDLVRAKRKGKAVGWFQGAGVVFAGGAIAYILGHLWWIPTILILAAIAYGLLKRASKKGSGGENFEA